MQEITNEPGATLDVDDSSVEQRLFDAAAGAAGNAYAKYSGFKVGAAVMTDAGNLYVGANVENVSYPVGVCAEAMALGAARVAEGKNFRLAAIAIYATKNDQQQICSPCGACRQRIVEFNPQAKVWFLGRRRERLCRTAADLLPEQFDFLP